MPQPPKAGAKPMLSDKSQAALSAAHPLLKKWIATVIADNPKLKFQILEARRGRSDQERAFAKGNSKARFGQSAHNWTPALALDITPVPLDWNNVAAFKALAPPFKAAAKKAGVPLRWLGPVMGDYPHWELDPWRDYTASAKLYGANK
jgi:peptidoglycan L-alanyl-D-glutamate endopeptidase CwlK